MAPLSLSNRIYAIDFLEGRAPLSTRFRPTCW
jgi:hypothetical protein